MSYPQDQREDRPRSSKVIGELLLLHALQAADFGLIAEFWISNQIEEEGEGVVSFPSY